MTIKVLEVVCEFSRCASDTVPALALRRYNPLASPVHPRYDSLTRYIRI